MDYNAFTAALDWFRTKTGVMPSETASDWAQDASGRWYITCRAWVDGAPLELGRVRVYSPSLFTLVQRPAAEDLMALRRPRSLRQAKRQQRAA